MIDRLTMMRWWPWRRQPTPNPPAPPTPHAPNPCGQFPPSVVPLGYTLTVDDFTGSTLGPLWTSPYDGKSEGAQEGRFKATHLKVEGSCLVLQMYQDPGADPADNDWAGAGVQTKTQWPVGTKIRAAVRLDAHPSITGIGLLIARPWESEVDFFETTGGLHSFTASAIHNTSKTPREQVQVKSPVVDWTKWHVIGVDRTPETIVYWLYGQPWATIPNPNPDPKDLQSLVQPMTLAFQIQDGDPSRPLPDPTVTAANPVQMLVDWVAIYVPS